MAAVAKDPKEKIASLRRYLEVIERQLKTPPAKRNKEAYEAWARLEIKRTLLDIDKLSVV